MRAHPNGQLARNDSYKTSRLSTANSARSSYDLNLAITLFAVGTETRNIEATDLDGIAGLAVHVEFQLIGVGKSGWSAAF
jgi:hypothetical protein